MVYLFLLFLLVLGAPDPPESLQLDPIVMHEGYFYGYAQNRYEIVKLNKRGDIVARVGRQGRGPAEFSVKSVRMTFVGDTLYAYDGMNKRIILFNEDLDVVDQRMPKLSISYLLFYDGRLYRQYLDLKKPEERTAQAVRRIAGKSDHKVAPMAKNAEPLATYPNELLTPLYTFTKVRSNGYAFAFFHPYQNMLRVYHDDSLKKIRLPQLEKLAIGQPMELKEPIMKQLYSEYPYMPSYELIANVLLEQGDEIVLQVKSFEQGRRLIFYDLRDRAVTNMLPSPKGQLVGRENGQFYFYRQGQIHTIDRQKLERCDGARVTFYISSVTDLCEKCRRSLVEYTGWLDSQHIPLRLVIEDSRWFSSPDRDDFYKAVKKMKAWDFWAAVEYTDDCDDCFEGGLNMRVNDGALFSLPAPISELRPKIPCVN